MMKKSEAGSILPIASAENFVETEFEEKFVYYAQRYGLAGKELESGRKMTEEDFRMPDENKIVVCTVEKYEDIKDEESGKTIRVPVQREERRRYADAYPERFKAEVSRAMRAMSKYEEDKQELCNDLLLHLDKTLRAAVTQHTDYKVAKAQDDVIKLWEIVVECATGRGAHSVYVSMMKFINLKQKSDDLVGFTEYVKKYNETVTDLIRVGDRDPSKVLRWLFNAKFVQGLHAEQFRDHIKNIMGKEQWPDYEELQAQLKRYVTASKGITETLLPDNPGGTIIADAANTTIRNRFTGECYNCGKKNAGHRARDCPADSHECSKCGKFGHLEKYCKSKDVDTQNDKRMEGNKGKNGNTNARDGSKETRSRSERLRARRTEMVDNRNDEEFDNEEELFDEYDDGFMCSKRGVITIDEEKNAMKCNMAATRDEDKDKDDELFAIDSCCIGHGHLVRREDLLATPRQASVTIQGYDGVSTRANTVGHVSGVGKAVLVKDAPNNLINLRKLCGEIKGHYEGDAESMTIYDGNNKVYAIAKDYGDGFLSLKYGDVKTYEGLVKANVATVGQRADMEHFSAEEIARAKDAYELCALLGHPGHKAICRSLDNGNYTHCHLTSEDMRNGLKLYGKCAGCIEGKTKTPKALVSKTPPAQKIGDNILIDIRPFPERAIGGYMGELFAVDEKSSYCMVVGLRSKTDITKAAEIVMSHYNANRHRVKHFTMDDERVFENRLKPLEKYGITSSATPAGLKNKRAERYVQTLKDRERSMRATLPYELPGNLSMELSMAAIKGMNITSNRVSGTRTPHEIFYGTKHMIPKCVFGQPGIAYKSGDKECRGQWGIFLGYRDHQHYNNMRVYIPETGCVVSRMRFDPVDVVPKEWGFTSRLKQKINDDGVRAIPTTLPIPRKEFETVAMENLPDVLAQNRIIQNGALPPQPSQAEIIASSSGGVQHRHSSQQDQEGDRVCMGHHENQEGDSARAMSNERNQEGEIAYVRHQEGVRKNAACDERRQEYETVTAVQHLDDHAAMKSQNNDDEGIIASESNANNKSVVNMEQAQERRRRLPRKAAEMNWKDGSAANRNHYNRVEVNNEHFEKELRQFLRVYRTSLARAMKEDDKKEQRMLAAKAEITNLYVKQKCFKPVKRERIPKQHLTNIVSGHMFFKDKYRADGSYDQCKARLVANGNEENPMAIESTRAPTVNPISLKCTLAKSTKDVRYTNDAYDVVGAFVCTEMRKGKTVIVKVGKQLAALFVMFYPELEDYLDEHGNLYFYLLKFLYGLAEAARGFNGKLHKVLMSIGYTRSESDECLYLKRMKDGRLHHLCVHVDDIYSAAPSEEAREEFESLFSKHFEFKKQYDAVSYLGMMIRKDKKSGEITIDQRGYINELLEKYDVNEKAVRSPARPSLMNESENKEYLEDRKEYVSMVMALMYVARLTRADILMPVTYLATKCSMPTKEDYCNARWVLRYLKGTRKKVLSYKKSDMVLRFYADASYLLHADGKGHSGYLAMLGDNLIMARSGKQKIQARSSTESEIISVEECATYVVYLRHLCKEMDIPVVGPTMVGQDNKSTIIIVEQGGTFKRTKHLIGRMSYLRECIEKGELTLKYVPTRFMKADMLTKPVPRETVTRHMEGVGIIG